MSSIKLPPIPWEKLEQLKGTHKIGIAAGSWVVIAGAFFYFLIMPIFTDIRTLTEQIEQAEAQLKIMRSAPRLKEINEAPGKLRRLNRELDISRSFLPDKDQVDLLLKNVSDRAQASGLNVFEFKPTKTTGSSLQGGFLAEVPFSTIVEGPFINVASFLYKISQLPRIVRIKSIKMINPIMREGDLILTTTLIGTTYRFIEAPKPVVEEPEDQGKK